jgi:hypothetical protein
MRRRRERAQPFPILGRIGKSQLATVYQLCRPGELPRFVLAEGTNGALAAFADRCAIIKTGRMTTLMFSLGRAGRLNVFPYSEIAELRFVPRTFTGTLMIVPVSVVDDQDYRGDIGNAYKRSDALPLSKAAYDDAREQLAWLRNQIAGRPTPPVDFVGELERLAELWAEEALSDEEYEQAKRILLDRDAESS